jgi:hypothetical protein
VLPLFKRTGKQLSYELNDRKKSLADNLKTTHNKQNYKKAKEKIIEENPPDGTPLKWFSYLYPQNKRRQQDEEGSIHSARADHGF